MAKRGKVTPEERADAIRDLFRSDPRISIRQAARQLSEDARFAGRTGSSFASFATDCTEISKSFFGRDQQFKEALKLVYAALQKADPECLIPQSPEDLAQLLVVVDSLQKSLDISESNQKAIETTASRKALEAG